MFRCDYKENVRIYGTEKCYTSYWVKQEGRMDYKTMKNMVLRKIDRSEYIEDLKYARGCTANRVYPVSIATGTQDGDIYDDGKGCVLFWHYCGFAYISGDVSEDVLEVYRNFLVSDTERRFLLITDSEFVSDYYSGIDLLRVDKRIEYTHSGILEKQPELDDCFVIERITSDNIRVIQGRITPSFSWNDSDMFLRNGFGFKPIGINTVIHKK